MENINNSWPYFDEDMISSVSRVLESGKVNYWTGDLHELEDGTIVRGENGLFEYEFAKYHHVPYAISLANGSLALELALEMFGVGIGDEVITTSRTFIASASSVWMRGAIPVFADIEKFSQNISSQTLEPLINKRTRAVIVVHLAGLSCEMDEIINLLTLKGKEYGHKIFLIEDCAQSLGGEYKNCKLGSIGDAGCFSFCQDKIITTGGEGGMLITKNSNAYRKAWSFKDHGKNFDKYNRQLKHPLVIKNDESSSFYTSLGTNWRMTEIQAAIGRIALSKLDSWNLKNRNKFAQLLHNSLSKLDGIQVPTVPDYIKHAYYKFYLFLEIEKFKVTWDRDRVIKEINKNGVICQYGSTWGIGSEEAWASAKMANGDILDLRTDVDLPNDKWVGERTLMFQVHPTLTEKHIDFSIKVIKSALERAIN